MPIEIRWVGALGEGPLEPEVAADRQAEAAGKPGLEGRDADLAVPLHPVAVAGEEQGTLGQDGEIEGRAGLQLLVVHVAAEGAGHVRDAAPPGLGRRHRHDAEKGLERQLRAPGQGGDPARPVDPGMDGLIVGELVGQRAQQRHHGHEAPVLVDLNVQDVDLQHVAGLGPAHEGGAGQDVGAGPLRHLVEDQAMGRRHEARVRRQTVGARRPAPHEEQRCRPSRSRAPAASPRRSTPRRPSPAAPRARVSAPCKSPHAGSHEEPTGARRTPPGSGTPARPTKRFRFFFFFSSYAPTVFRPAGRRDVTPLLRHPRT